MAKNHKKKSKEDNSITILGKVTTEPEQFEFEDKTKTVFDIKSRNGNTATCIYWADTKLEKDEKIYIKGQFKNGVFLIWNLVRNYEYEELGNADQND